MKHIKTAAAKTLLLSLNSPRCPRKPYFTGVSGMWLYKLHFHCIIYITSR